MSEDKLYGNDQILHAGGFHYAIVAARFNAFIVDRLLDAALDTLKACGAPPEHVDVYRVPGAFEIPLACQKVARTGRFDAIIALGCVIRGDTPHFDYVCSESARGISEVALKFDIPVINGVLTTDNRAQAEVRADTASGSNKGVDAAKAAMEVLSVYAGLESAPAGKGR